MITVIDAIYSKSTKDTIPLVADQLKYEKRVRVPSAYGVKLKTVVSYKIDRRSGLFLSGLLPLLNLPDSVEVNTDNLEVLHTVCKPRLEGITLRPSQQEAIEAATKKGRGIIHSFPGTGKTVMVLGFLSQFVGYKILILCHSIDILRQTKETAEKVHLKGRINFFYGKTDWDEEADICISSIQSFSKLDPNKYGALYDVMVVDEAHHCTNMKGQYGKVLQTCLAPVRIGLTGSLPKSKENRLTMYGLLGPVIYKMGFKQGVELKILSNPKIKIIPVKPEHSIQDKRSFKDIYKKGVIENEQRNGLIAKTVRKMTKKGKSVLVMVREIKHGDALLGKIRKMGVEVEFVQGSTDPQKRKEVKKDLINKKLKAVIATTAWKEGVDIPTLDCFICGYIGKSDVSVLQGVGRALRRAEGKEKALIVDFADPYNYLAQHFVQRIRIYVRNGWL